MASASAHCRLTGSCRLAPQPQFRKREDGRAPYSQPVNDRPSRQGRVVTPTMGPRACDTSNRQPALHGAGLTRDREVTIPESRGANVRIAASTLSEQA